MIFQDLGEISPEESIRIENSLFEDRSGNHLTIYSRNRPTVSLGRFNDPDASIDMKYARDHNIAVVRRISGGSAIYCDPHQLTYSLIVERDSFSSKEESYEVVCNCLIDTLAHIGITAEFKPRNDVLVNGMKISGCAQYRNRDSILHHGSLILKLDSETMDSVLKPVKDRKYGRLTSVEEVLGTVPSREALDDAFRKGFSKF